MTNIIELQSAIQWVFDRQVLPSNPWFKAINDLEVDKKIDRKALCSNWRMDHRVSKSREKSMLDSSEFTGQPDGEEFIKQIQSYFYSALCRPFQTNTGEQPVYLETHNDSNRVQNKIPPFDLLIHVGSLNGILWRLSGNESSGGANLFGMEFEQITNCSLPIRMPGETAGNRPFFNSRVDAVVESLIGKGEEAIKQFGGLLCDSLGINQPHWWACFAEEVNKYIQSEDWSSLCKALGVGHLAENEWIIIWQYEVSDAKSLFRPTVVEANTSPYHYPSPPSSQFGITMPLGVDLPNCREVIHPPLFAPLATETCTGKLCKIQGFPSDNFSHQKDIPSFRDSHRRRLKQEFADAKDQNWFERHKKVL